MAKNLAILVRPLIRPFSEFIHRETSGGVVLLISSALALVLANTDVGIARYFPAIWEHHLTLSIGGLTLEKSLLHWINDGLMALFFLVVGLEIKREVLEGELSNVRKAALPMVAALGGMLVPALLFTLLNSGSTTSNGWGIPMATDIAFALAVLLMLGNKVPLSLKVFLTALAIVDDLGAVVVIALFYTEDLQTMYLLWAGLVWGGMLALNYLGVRALSVYLALGVVLWYFTLQSGIHATIAGVLLAVAIPFRIRYSDEELVRMLEDRLGVIRQQVESKDIDPRCISEELEALHETVRSPAQHLEQQLHQLVSFVIVPLFAFCNTSLVIEPEVLQHLVTPLGMGVLLGLVVGKPLGITLFSYLAVRLGWAALPAGVRWSQLAGVGVLGGIGFTMSIFVTLLAFEANLELQAIAKVAILLASLIAGLLGYGLLQRQTRSGPVDIPY